MKKKRKRGYLLMPELSADAEEFIPEYIQEENKLFDRLEKEFMEQNIWLFFV